MTVTTASSDDLLALAVVGVKRSWWNPEAQSQLMNNRWLKSVVLASVVERGVKYKLCARVASTDEGEYTLAGYWWFYFVDESQPQLEWQVRVIISVTGDEYVPEISLYSEGNYGTLGSEVFGEHERVCDILAAKCWGTLAKLECRYRWQYSEKLKREVQEGDESVRAYIESERLEILYHMEILRQCSANEAQVALGICAGATRNRRYLQWPDVQDFIKAAKNAVGGSGNYI